MKDGYIQEFMYRRMFGKNYTDNLISYMLIDIKENYQWKAIKAIQAKKIKPSKFLTSIKMVKI